MCEFFPQNVRQYNQTEFKYANSLCNTMFSTSTQLSRAGIVNVIAEIKKYGNKSHKNL